MVQRCVLKPNGVREANQSHHPTHRLRMHPIRQPSQAGLADPSLGQPRQEQQLVCTPSPRTYARHPHAKVVSLPAVVSRATPTAAADVSHKAEAPAPRGLLLCSSVALNTAGLRSPVAPHELGRHLSYGMPH